jgi:hypothetical protein
MRRVPGECYLYMDGWMSGCNALGYFWSHVGCSSSQSRYHLGAIWMPSRGHPGGFDRLMAAPFALTTFRLETAARSHLLLRGAKHENTMQVPDHKDRHRPPASSRAGIQLINGALRVTSRGTDQGSKSGGMEPSGAVAGTGYCMYLIWHGRSSLCSHLSATFLSPLTSHCFQVSLSPSEHAPPPTLSSRSSLVVSSFTSPSSLHILSHLGLFPSTSALERCNSLVGSSGRVL